MAVTYRRISVNAIERDVKAAFLPTAQRISGLIASSAGADGTLNHLSRQQRLTLIDRVGDLVQALFVGANNKPYAADGVSAIAPFPQVLNRWYVRVVGDALRAHYNDMKRRMPDDMWRWLSAARIPAGTKVSEQVSTMMTPGFLPNALAQYDPMHSWVDPNGYILSQRIWRIGGDARQRQERLLTDLIAEGRSAVYIARRMEQFLVPGREKVRTRRPYGSDNSFDAMRLARSEIASAANRAALLAARLNPYVTTIDIARSATGDPTCPICGGHASIDINQQRVREPYPVDGVPGLIFHPHCKCRYQSNVGAAPGQIAEELRVYLESGEMPPVTPAVFNWLMLLLLGSSLYELWKSEET